MMMIVGCSLRLCLQVAFPNETSERREHNGKSGIGRRNRKKEEEDDVCFTLMTV